MTDRQSLSAYVDPDVADEVEARAEANDESVSSWVTGAVRQRLEEDRMGRAVDKYEVERRLERLVDESADRAAKMIAGRLDLDTSSPSTESSDEFADWGES